MRDGNIIATIPTPQIAVNNNRAETSSMPAMGMLALATTNQERMDRAPSVAPRT